MKYVGYLVLGILTMLASVIHEAFLYSMILPIIVVAYFDNKNKIGLTLWMAGVIASALVLGWPLPWNIIKGMYLTIGAGG